MKNLQIYTIFRISIATLFIVLAVATPVNAQGLAPGLDTGRISMGAGLYQAPNAAISDSGLYTFTRYEIADFEIELDYGVSDQNFFLGAVDYLYQLPAGSGITQTDIALGGGVTFVSNDPSVADSKFGPNLLGQIWFMDALSVQLRYDFLGEDANLWTFGVSFSF